MAGTQIARARVVRSTAGRRASPAGAGRDLMGARQESSLDRALGRAADGAFVSTGDGKIVPWNRTADEILGDIALEAPGRPRLRSRTVGRSPLCPNAEGAHREYRAVGARGPLSSPSSPRLPYRSSFAARRHRVPAAVDASASTATDGAGTNPSSDRPTAFPRIASRPARRAPSGCASACPTAGTCRGRSTTYRP